jgi:site-specific recombinase XerD
MTNPTLETAYSDYVILQKANGLAETTMETRRYFIRRMIESFPWGTLVSDITPRQMREYVAELRKAYSSQHTIADHITVLKHFWAFVEREYGTADPTDGIRRVKPPVTKPRAVPLANVAAALKAAKGQHKARDQAMILFALDTGCRAAGVCSLKMADLNLAARRAVVTEKGGKTRTVLFSEVTREYLSLWLSERTAQVEHVFYALDTLEPLGRNGFLQMLRRLCRRAGVPVFSPHDLRHTFSRGYLDNGGNLATLSKLLGHQDVSTTLRYYLEYTDGEIAAAHERYSPVNVLGLKEDGGGSPQEDAAK